MLEATIAIGVTLGLVSLVFAYLASVTSEENAPLKVLFVIICLITIIGNIYILGKTGNITESYASNQTLSGSNTTISQVVTITLPSSITGSMDALMSIYIWTLVLLAFYFLLYFAWNTLEWSRKRAREAEQGAEEPDSG